MTRSPQEVEDGTVRPVRGGTLFITVVSAGQVTLGLGFQVLLGYLFGTRHQMDEFLVATAIPQLVQLVLGASLTVSLTPCWALWRHKGVGSRAMGAALLFYLAAAGTLSFALIGVSGTLPGILAPGLARTGDPILAGFLLRALAPVIIAQTLVAFLTASAIARKRYGLWPIAGLVGLGLQLGITWVAAPRYGIAALAGAYLIGACVQLLIVTPYFPGEPRGWPGGFRFLGDLLRTAGAVTVKGVVSRFTTVSDRWIASWLGPGSISQVVYGSRLAQAFATVLASGIATTILPDLSQLKDSKNERFELLVNAGIRTMSFLVLPIAAVLVVWSDPLVRTIFGRGAFTMQDVAATASVLRYAAGWFTVSTIGVPVIMALYALEQHGVVSVVSIVTGIVNLGLSYVLALRLGVEGIPLAFSITALANLSTFALILRRLRRNIVFSPWKSLRDPNLISFLSVTLVLVLVYPLREGTLPVTLAETASVLSRLLLAACCYLATAHLLGSQELLSIRETFQRFNPAARIARVLLGGNQNGK